MPKKCGENSKAVAARARKEEAASSEKARRAKEAEDALWADDDKHIAKKQVPPSILMVWGRPSLPPRDLCECLLQIFLRLLGPQRGG